jgi:hypothetical protein
MDERERVLLTLAGMRVFMGIFWLVNLLWRLPTDFGGDSYWGVPHILELARHFGISPPVRSLVVHVLAPHSTTVGCQQADDEDEPRASRSCSGS